jgi:hypothetical protein
MKSRLVSFFVAFASLGAAHAEELQFYYDVPTQSTECFLSNLVEGHRTIARV